MDTKIKVFVADESADFTMVCAEALRIQGFEVCTGSRNGTQVLQEILKQKPDIVLINSFLAYLDGSTVVREALNAGIGKPPKFIMMSGVSNMFLEQEAAAAGVSYLIIKPFDCRVVAEKIRRLYYGGEMNENPFEKQNLSASDRLEMTVTEMIQDIGIPAHLKGYRYLRRGIILYVEDASVRESITKHLYPAIAKEFPGATASRVERAIRNAIEVAWENNRVDMLYKYFGGDSSSRPRPTNSEVIARLSDQILVNLKYG